MKNFRIVLMSLALLFAIAGTVTSKILPSPITQGDEFSLVSDCSPEALDESTCDTDATAFDCHLDSNPSIVAYRSNGTACVVPIKRNQ